MDSCTLSGMNPSIFNEGNISDLSKFVLFEGKNGTGKSTLLKWIEQKSKEIGRTSSDPLVTQYVASNFPLSLDCRTQSLSDVNNPDTPFHYLDIRRLTQNEEITEKIQNLLSSIFNRKLKINIREPTRTHFDYWKNNTWIPYGADGTGIFNAFCLFRLAWFVPPYLPIFVEEISSGIYPALLPIVLDEFFKIAQENNHQVFITTQDPFVVYYFMKNKLTFNAVSNRFLWEDKTSDYSVFKCEEIDNRCSFKKINESNFPTTSSSLIDDKIFDFAGIEFIKFCELFWSSEDADS